jgi:hypothetical protein
VRPDVEYFNLQTPENNPGCRTKWYYAKDKSSVAKTLDSRNSIPPAFFDLAYPGDTTFRTMS